MISQEKTDKDLKEGYVEAINIIGQSLKDLGLIDKYKEQKYKVGIFVTGKEDYPEILNKIVAKQVELSGNVC